MAGRLYMCTMYTSDIDCCSGVHLGKSPRGVKSASEDILGVCAYSEQYSFLKGSLTQTAALNVESPHRERIQTVWMHRQRIWLLGIGFTYYNDANR